MIKKYLISILFFTFFVVSPAYAARIFFEPASNTHEVGESFTINVRIDTQGENINAVDLSILYPPLLEINSISKNGSVIQIWVGEPNYTSTGIFLVGGVPGGIKTSNGLIAKITTKAKAIGDGSFQLTPASSALLSDGEGTKASLITSQVSFNVTAKPKKESTLTPKESEKVKPLIAQEEEQEKEESKDKSKPKKFQILLGQDPRVFNGKYFVSFFTTDSKTGVDHYEIKEGHGPYKVSQAPYLLSDQELKTVIRIRAYDGAGNYRESIYPGWIKRLWLWILDLF